MNDLFGTAEENGIGTEIGEHMRAGDEDPDIRVIATSGYTTTSSISPG